jgi:hypothetical protein
MKTLAKNGRSKSRRALNRQAGQSTRFIPYGARVWRGKWGTGICAHEGYLLTDCRPFPSLIGWADDFQTIRDFLDAKVGMENLVEVGQSRGVVPLGIGTNLLFPVHMRTGMLISDDEAFAAAHFAFTPDMKRVTGFCILTHAGLEAASGDIDLAKFHHKISNEKGGAHV